MKQVKSSEVNQKAEGHGAEKNGSTEVKSISEI